jgi:Predicted permeases
MNKLIFRKFSLDILNFFLIASFSITFIVWIIQAVNLLDLVSDDGHSLKIYFYYVSLNLPKIFSKIIVFVFFISIFYVINKYNNSNELLVFWNNGIQKIKFINFILMFSLLFLIIQLALNLFIGSKIPKLRKTLY